MKKMLNMLSKFSRPLAGLLLIMILFAACKKQDYSSGPVPPAAGLMAFNLSPDQPAIGFDIANNRLANNSFGYTNYTGAYLPVYPGNSEVRVFDYNNGSTLASSTFNFVDSGYYSTFLIGTNGMYRNLTVEDKLASIPVTNGKAWVRYINAIPDSASVPVINVSSNADNTINDTARYGTVSEFVPVNAGQVNVSINNGNNISSMRSINLDEHKVYTLLFVGMPAAADTASAVQIRFIQNGTITP